MPGDRSILSSGRAEQAHVTAEGWRGRLPSPPLECSGPQAVELRRDSASSARHRARRVCRRAGDERACGVDIRCPETVFRWSTPTSTGRGTRTPGGRNGRLVVEDLGVRVGELGDPPTRCPRVELERDAPGRSSSRSLSLEESLPACVRNRRGSPDSPCPRRFRWLAGRGGVRRLCRSAQEPTKSTCRGGARRGTEPLPEATRFPEGGPLVE